MSADTNPNDPIAPNQQLVIAELRNQLARYEKSMASLVAKPEDEDSIDLREYWKVLVRRKWTVYVSMTVLLVGTLIATAMIKPIYRASTVVQIERDSGKVLEYQNITAEEAVNDKDFYQTQYELLQSRTLARRVIDQLGLQESGALLAKKVPGFAADITERFKDMIGRSDVEMEEDSLGEDLETMFLENLTVQPVKNSRLVRLYYESPEPHEAALVANTLAASFVEMNLERRFDASTYAKGFLEERIKQVRADLEDSEQGLVEYAQVRGIINQDDRLGILTEKLKEMNRAQVAVQAERFEAESQYQEMLTAETESLTDMLESPVIQNLKNQRSELLGSYKENLKTFKPAYPKMQSMTEKIAQLEAEIDREIANIRDGIKIQYQAKRGEEVKLSESIGATRDEILDLQYRSTDFQTLKRVVDTNRELYDGLLQRMKEVGVAAGVSNNNISIVDKAEVPRKQFKPDFSKNTAIALVLGLLGGVLLAFLFESLDDTVKSGADLEKLINKPVLGVIPRLGGANEIPLADCALIAFRDPTAAISEAYRSMRTAMTFSTEDGAPKVMQFTSINANEGKTVTAVNIAINFTQTGSNVLLIDGDLRDPSLHKLFGCPNDKGLTNYLTGDAKPAEVTQASGIKRLFVITAGPIPPNPAELLHGAKMIDLVTLASKRFDYVIIDSPPLLGLADALILADLAHATLLIAAAKSTRIGAIETGLKRLRHSRANILGTVLTKFDLNSSNYGYDYSYSYSYGGDSTSHRQSA